MAQALRRGLVRPERHVHEQDAELPDRERRRFGAAPAADRETLADYVLVQLEEDTAGFVEDLDLLQGNRQRRRIGQPQFVDEVDLRVAAAHRPGRPQDIGNDWRKRDVGGEERCRCRDARQESSRDGYQRRTQSWSHDSLPPDG
jgi:hypothetical protein